ncbi:MAG: pyrroline-5-carboxylate reductase [Bacteroidales bacterium]|nr:pyrroline-5-carboxylate reductase [Bacteroidales bacterium]
MNTIAIIGAGNMGAAIARGLARNNYNIRVSNPSAPKLERLQAECPGIVTTMQNCVAVKDASVVIIAVRPDKVRDVLAEIHADLDDGALVVTLSPAFSLADLGECLPDHAYGARLMPNTAIAVGSSMSFISYGDRVPSEVRARLTAAIELLGAVAVIPESLMGAATALCSCGLAFAMRYVRASVEGAVQLGIAPADATRYVAATLAGAAAMLEADGLHPEAEIDRVTTPGGTTIRGLNAMEAAGFSNAVIQGLLASSHE